MNTERLFDAFPDLFFGSLKEQMFMGILPSETVETLLKPLLEEYDKIMPQLPVRLQNDIKDIFKIYPEIAEEYAICIEPECSEAEIGQKLLREDAVNLINRLKDIPTDLQKLLIKKFTENAEIKNLVALLFTSKEKTESDEDKKHLDNLWQLIKQNFEDTFSTQQVRFAKSSKPEEVKLFKLEGDNISGSLSIFRGEDHFLLSGYYRLSESNKVLILNLPDSYIVLEPKYAVHIFPWQEEAVLLNDLGIEKYDDNLEFEGILLKNEPYTISYEISDPYFDIGGEL